MILLPASNMDNVTRRDDMDKKLMMSTPAVDTPHQPVPPVPMEDFDPDTYEPWDPETDEDDDPAQVDENGVCIADPDAEDRKHVIH